MRTSLTSKILILIIISSVFPASCTRSSQPGQDRTQSSPEPSDPGVAGSPSDKLEELRLLIKMPYDPEDGGWRLDPRSKKLTAVLIFSPQDAAKLLNTLRESGSGEDVEIAVESWFPDELIAKSEMSGDADLRGKAYPAAPFLTDRFRDGRIIHIEETEIFIVELR